MIKVFNWQECEQQHCLRMILADSLYTISLFNTASFHFRPANVLNLWPMVHRYFCISSLWWFYWTGSLPTLQVHHSSLCTFPEQIRSTCCHLCAMGRLVFLLGPPSPPHPCTWKWPLYLKFPSKPSFSMKLSGPMVRITFFLAPYSCHHITVQVLLERNILLLLPLVSVQCLASRRTFFASD